MSQNMASHWQFGISETHCGSWVGHHLISDQNSDIELVGQLEQFGEGLIHELLSIRELSSSSVVSSKERNEAINNQQRELFLHHLRSSQSEQVVLNLSGVDSAIDDVLKGLCRVQPESFRDFCYLVGSESPHCVDVNYFPPTSALFLLHLGSHGQCVAQLSLPRPELSENLSDGHGLYSALQ